MNAIFNKDETTILSCSGDKTIKLWNKDNGTLIRNFEGHTSWVIIYLFIFIYAFIYLY